MEHSESSPSLTAVVLVSLALHAVAAVALASGGHAARPSQREPIRVTVREVARPEQRPLPVEPAAEPAAPAPQAIATHAPRSKEKRAARTAQPDPPAPAEPASAPASAPEALDFTGVTLTNPNGGFAQVAGNGQAMNGPLGASSGAAGRGTSGGTGSGNGTGKGASQGAELVALGSLSRPPRAPALDQALAANYPRSAHDLGLAGEAVVRARILPSGQVGPTSVIVASAPEFGKACQRTLAGSRWSAPLDATGRPVATELSYKCVFEVTR